jgi:hypothetical protein
MRTALISLPLLLVAAAAGQPAPRLPQPVVTELKRLEETYRVLDFAAEKVWPGWNTYRKAPFLLDYENGLRVLIGHPNPPPQFQAVPDLKVEDKAVFADWTAVTPKPLLAPLRAGGGPIPFGASPDGRPLEVVHMSFRSVPSKPAESAEPESNQALAEDQMLIYIHELFHCFQRELPARRMYGNLQYNPDVTYAVYSELEGLALERAYLETDAAKGKQFLADFLAARRRKRASSMNTFEQNQESFDEFNEGTAVCSEFRTLEILKAGGFAPKLTAAQDSDYHGFSDPDRFLRRYPERLNRAAARTEDPRSKSYEYGCFQAVLCDRWFPGWQTSVAGATEFIDRELGRRLAVPDDEWSRIEQRLQQTYPFAEIQKRHTTAIEARDDAYRALKARTGRVYVIDFKKTGQYVPGAIAGTPKVYRLGLINMYPEGVGTLKFDEVEVTGLTAPAEANQLYYLRLIDTDWRQREKPYTLDGTPQPDGTFKNAVLRTPLFTLKAPRVRILQAGDLVKIQVLARVKE